MMHSGMNHKCSTQTPLQTNIPEWLPMERVLFNIFISYQYSILQSIGCHAVASFIHKQVSFHNPHFSLPSHRANIYVSTTLFTQVFHQLCSWTLNSTRKVMKRAFKWCDYCWVFNYCLMYVWVFIQGKFNLLFYVLW